MIRITAWALALFALAAGAAWLAAHPGRIAIDWGGVRIETSMAVACLGIGVLVIVGAVLHRLWRWIRRGPRSLGRSRAAGRRRRGYAALTRGMVAVAAGDAAEAKRCATAAETLLDEPPLTLLLTAQAAQLAGNEAGAGRAYRAMLERPETAFLGLRGLIVQALRRGDRVRALELTRRAALLKPNAAWVVRELVSLESSAGRMDEAAAALARGLKARALPASEGARYQAVLALAAAEQAERHLDQDAALKNAVKAAVLAPALTPAVVLAVRLLKARGKERKAAGLLADAWAKAPHPDLAAACLDLHGGETAERRLARLKDLLAGSSGRDEGRLALARALLAAGDLAAARHEIETLLRDAPSQGAARAMAEIETAQYGDGHSASAWLQRAATLPPDPAWTCTACGSRAARWTSHCESCGAFDHLAWRAAQGVPTDARILDGAALLPGG